MESKNLEVSKQDGKLVVTFNRPNKLNAWSEQLVDELTTLLEEASFDNEIKVIVLTGKGKAFSAGGDLDEFLASTPQQVEKYNRKVIDLFRLMEKMRKPIIAAVNGYCNLETIQAVDYVLASTTAKFGLPEINVAISPGAGILVRLPRLVGHLKTKEIALFGEWIDAETAVKMGLVNRVVSPEELMRVADELATKLASKAPLTLGAIKAVINNSQGMGKDEAMEYQLKENSSLFNTEDLREGIKAFLEKRKPVYKGK
ncbi:crotonase [Sulfodiicoccus acidiphilus]|uniref:Crotonase n=1 Tax=Sulfodiicoccus acidiphilus TaxID=1670455 RepID=A0A348B1I7_9CREN|nr:enoyl-CoA hydratase/isomerase family protein [Sulfodiicoccus acidiphilus]BBD72039.1 crotonase [Sulfodiicoccus acidiphilus]GGU00230.1 crotonase [Sulfodiicoccus acidiphilus]